MRFLPSGRVRLTALVAVVLGLAAGGIAYASIPGPGGVINGCYLKSGGALRVIDSAAKCKSGETSLNWNQKGPTGARGPTGANGTTGATGPTGPSGTSGYEIVTINDTFTENSPNLTKVFVDNVPCPSGKVVVGGGGSASFDTAGPADVAESYPLVGGGASRWGVGFARLDGGYFAVGDTLTYSIHAVCMNAS
jgi:hypothetical protein